MPWAPPSAAAPWPAPPSKPASMPSRARTCWPTCGAWRPTSARPASSAPSPATRARASSPGLISKVPASQLQKALLDRPQHPHRHQRRPERAAAAAALHPQGGRGRPARRRAQAAGIRAGVPDDRHETLHRSRGSRTCGRARPPRAGHAARSTRRDRRRWPARCWACCS